MSTILNVEEEKKGFFKENKVMLIVIAVVALIVAAIFFFVLKEEKPLETPDFKTQYSEVEVGATVAEITVKDYGTIKIQLFESKAPKACKNFITHAKDGYYDGVTFHRIIDDFMIQGGDPTGSGSGGESIWGTGFENEITNDLLPIRGSLCMANTGQENSNGSQFFIVQKDSYMIEDVMTLRKADVPDELVDYYKEVGGACWLWGKHTVFGQVFEGMDVVDKIAAVETDSNDAPNTEVVIETVKIYQYK